MKDFDLIFSITEDGDFFYIDPSKSANSKTVTLTYGKNIFFLDGIEVAETHYLSYSTTQTDWLLVLTLGE